MDQVIDQARQDFEGVLDLVRDDLTMVKTGRAKPSLVQQIEVEVYDTKMPLLELASITAPDPHQLVVKPWDQNIIKAIEKALASSDLGLNPVVDGELVRIKIPPLTEERRRDLVKLVKQKLESGRVLLRQARREAKDKIDKKEGQAGVSEDDVFRAVEELNKLTDEFGEKIEKMGEMKEKELMTA
jgi:ribosome recycling factor